MPKRWHTRLILQDKQDTVQIFYARKLQILNRISAHMTAWYVRPCEETLPLKFNHIWARAGRMSKRWHARLILEDKQDTGQVLYGRKLRSFHRVRAHRTTLCVRPCSRDPPTQIQLWPSARGQNAKKVVHQTDITGQAGYCADILRQKIADSQSHWCSHDGFVCETLFSRPSHSNWIVTERAQATCQKGGTQDWCYRTSRILGRYCTADNYRFSIASVHTGQLGVWDLVFETPPLKFNCDWAHAGRMPKKSHTRLILEDQQDTGHIFHARKLQILNRIGAHMMAWCVRPCEETLPLKFNCDRARAGRMSKRWHTRLIL